MSQFRERRKDSELRAAYSRVQKNKLNLQDKKQIYQQLLEELCVISESPDGFILEKTIEAEYEGAEISVICHRFKRGVNKRKEKHTSIDIPWELMAFFTEPKTGISQVKAQVFRDTKRDMINLSALGLPNFTQLLVIPLINGRGTVLALVCLADSKTPYAKSVAARLWPLLAVTANMLSTLQTKRSLTSKPTNLPATVMLPTALPLQPRVSNLDTQKATEDICPLAVIAVDEHFRVIRFNPAAEQLFGLPCTEALQKNISCFIPERFPQEHRSKLFTRASYSLAPHTPLFLTGKHANQRRIPIEVFVVAYNHAGTTHFLLYINDNTELAAVKAAQEDQIQRFKAVSDLAPIGILQTNRNWEAVYVNDQWCEICGLAREEAVEKGWINAFYNEDVSHTLESLRKAIVAGQAFDGECRFQTPVGDIVWVEFHARPLFNANGTMDGFIATLTDCTYRRITEHKLRTMAERDALTGLANRAMFQSRLDHALERTDRHGALALLCLDLDGFKNVNDTLGHDAGDILLIEVADRLKSGVRSEDTVARMGGDEFMILLEGLHNPNTAAEIAKKILPSIATPFYIAEQEVFISTSIGITFAKSQHGCDGKSLIKQSDIALYRAKSEGRNNFQYYSPELEKASKDRLYLSNSLHRALERNEFQVFYQLQADVSSKKLVGTEALLRWQHPERGLLPPRRIYRIAGRNPPNWPGKPLAVAPRLLRLPKMGAAGLTG